MATNETMIREIIRNSAGRVFTLSEACEFQRLVDSQVTMSANLGIRWKDVNTGRPVLIGKR